MPNTTVELFDANNLFGNALNNRTTSHRPGSHVTNVNSPQSETNVSDTSDEDTENIPFHEILSQHINTMMLQHTAGAQEQGNPASELNNTELSGDDSHKTNQLVLNIQMLSDTPALQNNGKNVSSITETDGSKIDAALQGFDSNPFLITSESGKKTDTGINFSAYSNLTTHDKKSLLSESLFPGGEETTQSEMFIKTDNQASPSQREQILIQNLFLNATPPLTGDIGLNPIKNPENTQQLNNALSDITQELKSDGSIFDSKDLPNEFKSFAQNVSTQNKQNTQTSATNNRSGIPIENTVLDPSKTQGNKTSQYGASSVHQINDGRNSTDSPSQEQDTSNHAATETPLEQINMEELNNGVPFSIETQMNSDTIQSKATDFQPYTLAPSGNNTTTHLSAAGQNNTVNHEVSNPFNTGTTENTQDNSIVEQIFQKIRLINNGDKSEIKLHLNPPELGSVKIHFSEENDEIEAKVFVENAEVKAAIENNAHHLKESVAAHGVEIHKFEVFVQNDDADKQNSFEDLNANNQHHHTGNNEGRNEDKYFNKENTESSLPPENSKNTSNLVVDYII